MLEWGDGPGYLAAADDPADRRAGGRLDRDRVPSPQRARRRVRRDARPRRPGYSRERLHREPQRPRPLRRAHGLRRRRRAARLPGLLLRDPRRGGRSAVRARPADRPLPHKAGARPRGVGARPPARRDGRLADHPPPGVERGARAPPRQRVPVRGDRPTDAARRADPVRLGREHVGRRPGRSTTARSRCWIACTA